MTAHSYLVSQCPFLFVYLCVSRGQLYVAMQWKPAEATSGYECALPAYRPAYLIRERVRIAGLCKPAPRAPSFHSTPAKTCSQLVFYQSAPLTKPLWNGGSANNAPRKLCCGRAAIRTRRSSWRRSRFTRVNSANTMACPQHCEAPVLLSLAFYTRPRCASKNRN